MVKPSKTSVLVRRTNLGSRGSVIGGADRLSGTKALPDTVET